MTKTRSFKRAISLLLAMVMLAAELVAPIGAVTLANLRSSGSTDSSSTLTVVDKIDLSGIGVGTLTDTNLTNYSVWKNSTNAGVSVKEETDGKYINVYDDDVSIAPNFHRNDLNTSTGIKTITFDLRVNAAGINATNASKNGAIFELKVVSFPENNSGLVYPDGSIELPAVPIIPASVPAIRLYFGDTLSIQYGSSGGISDTGIIVPEGEWAKVILVTTSADTFSLYYANEKLADSVSTINGRDFSLGADLFVYSESATAGSDFDIKNYAIYDGDISENLLPAADPDAPLDTVTLRNRAVGPLVFIDETNYDAENASVSVKEETDGKYINVHDNDAAVAPGLYRKNLDASASPKTIVFDLRVNALDANKNGPIFEIKASSVVASVYFKDTVLAQHSNSDALDNTGIAVAEDEWAKVICVINPESKQFTLYYGGEQLLYNVGTIYNKPFSSSTEVLIYSAKETAGSDFDIKNYAIYEGDVSKVLLLEPIETINLSQYEIGLLTDNKLTSYNNWSKSENASVSVKKENEQKYINVWDNDSNLQPDIHRYDYVFHEGVKTITFDLRINTLGAGGAVEIELYDITKGTSWVRLQIHESDIRYYQVSKSISKANGKAIMGEWATVILVVDSESNTYNFYYGGKEILYEVPPKNNADITAQPIDVQIRGNKAGVGTDFDIRDYRVYTDDQAYTLLGQDDPNAPVDVDNAGTWGISGKEINTDLGLPYSDNYIWTPVDITTSAYDNYLAKRADLAAATLAAGGSANEVKVLDPIAVRGAVEVYVAPNGSDKNNGSKQNPLKTLRRALAFVAELEAAGAQGVVVYLREGTYFADKTLSVAERHSGRNNIPVFISAYPNEEVIITGGMDIAGSEFTKVTDQAVLNKLQDNIQDKIVAFDLKSLGLTDFGRISGYNGVGGPNYTVQINGENLILARYPNAETIPMTGEILDVGPITGEDTTSSGAEFVMVDNRPLQWVNDGNIWFKGNLFAEWRVHNQRVAAINADKNSIKLEAVRTGDAVYFNAGAIAKEVHTHYYYNILEELDIPGEYYVDTTNGILYLYPTCDMSTATVTYTRTGVNLIEVKNAENIVINGLTLENTAGTAVRMYNCNQVVVQNCEIRNVGAGVLISGQKSGVIHSKFEYINDVAVSFTDYEISRNNFMQNCYLYCGENTSQKTSEINVEGNGHVISHNLIRDTYNNGMYLYQTKECVVEYNELVGGPTHTEDGGAIYQSTTSDTYNNHVRFNYIHDIGTKYDNSSDPWAIYFDDASCGSFAYGNIIQNTPGGLFTNSGSSHVFADNVVVNGREGTSSGVNMSNNYYAKTWEEWIAKFPADGTNLEKYQTDEEYRAELISKSPAMARRFEWVIENLAADGDGTGFLIPKNNQVVNNIIANHAGIRAKSNRGEDNLFNQVIWNNTVVNEDIFVDSKNGDFTLKSGVTLGDGTVYVAPDMSRMGILEHLAYEALHNLRLQDLTKIGYAFKITTEETVEEYGVLIWTDEIDAEVTVNTAGVQKKTLVLDRGYYTTESDGVYAQRLDVVHYAKPYIKVGDQYIYGDVDVYSPIQYAQTILGGSDEKLKRLMIDLLNYGTYAQLYFAETNQETAPAVLINDVLTAEQKTMNWSDDLKVATPTVTKDTAGTLDMKWYGTNLNLLEAVQMNMAAKGNIAGMYYWTEDAYNNAEALDSTTASGRTTIRVSEGYTIGGITGIVAQSIDDVYYVCCYDASGNLGAIRADSVAAYATRLIEKSTSTVATVNMAKALLAYGNSAMAYFSQSA